MTAKLLVGVDIDTLVDAEGVLRPSAIAGLKALKQTFDVWVWASKNGLRSDIAMLNILFDGEFHFCESPVDFRYTKGIYVTDRKEVRTSAFIIKGGINVDNRTTKERWLALCSNIILEMKGVNMDFDGVIHQYLDGWNGGKMGLPNRSAVSAIELLLENEIRVNVLSTRPVEQIKLFFANNLPFVANHRLLNFSNQRDFHYEKITIDDRAVPFTDWFEDYGRKIEGVYQSHLELKKYNATLKSAAAAV